MDNPSILVGKQIREKTGSVYEIKAGGPRFWPARLYEMRERASIRGESAACVTSATTVDLDNPGRPTVWLGGIALINGKAGHLAAWKPEPVERPQWCFPSRRQHAGSFESVSEAARAGAISEKLNRTSSRDARTRRTFYYSNVAPIPFGDSA